MALNDNVNEGSELQRLVQLGVHYAHGIWNYRWIAVAVVWCISIVGWLYVYSLPNSYSASTVVYVDTESVLRPLLKGLAVESDVMNEVGIMTRAIVSRPNLESVAREIDLDVQSRTPSEFDRHLKSLEERIGISADRQGVYTISYRDTSRETASKVVKSLLDTFVEDTLGTKTQDSATAERTLQEQIQEYERRMREAEDRLKNFKRENVGMMPGERGDYYDQLQTAGAERDDIEQRLRVERQKLDLLQRQLAGEEPVFGIMTPVTGNGSPLDVKIAELEQRLSNLSIEYTDRHPEVRRTQSLLEDLRARKQNQSAASGATAGPTASDPLELNPVYQNMKIQLGNTQLEIASLEATLQQKSATVERLRGLVDVIPQVEAELTRLNRDYDVVRSRYQEMLERWENLQTSQRVGSSSENVRFRIIEPPFAPTDPTGPPRVLFLFGVFIVALGSGLGSAFLACLLRPVYFRLSELSAKGVPTIGAVARISTPELQRRQMIDRTALAVSLAGVVLALVLVAAFAEPASELIRRVI